MALFRLTTCERQDEIVESTVPRLRAAMYAYIRARRAEGMALSDTVFCWSLVGHVRRI